MDPRLQTPTPQQPPMAARHGVGVTHTHDDAPDDPHPSLMDGFHWPPTVAERRALRHAAEGLVGPVGG